MRVYIWHPSSKPWYYYFFMFSKEAQGHVAADFVMPPAQFSTFERTEEFPKAVTPEDNELFVSAVGHGKFSNRITSFIKYGSSPYLDLDCFDIVDDDKVTETFKKIHSSARLRAGAIRRTEPLDDVDYHSCTDSKAMMGKLFVPYFVGGAPSKGFSTCNNPFNDQNSYNCTSLVKSLVEATGNNLNFLTKTNVSLFGVLGIVNGGLAGYNISEAYSIYVLNKARDVPDGAINLLEVIIFAIQIIWIVFLAMCRVKWFDRLNELWIHILITIVQVILFSVQIGIHVHSKNIQELVGSEDTINAWLFGGLAGGGVGLFYCYSANCFLGASAIYRPAMMRQLLLQLSKKSGAVERVSQTDALSWLSDPSNLTNRAALTDAHKTSKVSLEFQNGKATNNPVVQGYNAE